MLINWRWNVFKGGDSAWIQIKFPFIYKFAIGNDIVMGIDWYWEAGADVMLTPSDEAHVRV